MTQIQTDPMDVIYTPSDIVTIGSRYLIARRNHSDVKIPLYLKSIDKDLLPLLAGELVTVIGRPGCGKTGFMMRWARTRARELEKHNIQDRVVVYATYEQSIEELYTFNIAADAELPIDAMARGELTEEQWEFAQKIAAKRISLPLWFIGHSIERRKKRPNLTMSTLGNALLEIEKWNDDRTQIDMLFVDYLQRIKFEGKVESKTIGTSDNLDRLKDAALSFGCPVVVGVQAGREVDERALPIPAMDDGQWTSNIEQASDKIFSVVRPRKYKNEGAQFGSVIVQGNTQMLVSIIKQKLGIDNKAYWVYFDPAYNRLDELEMRNVDLNDTTV